MSGNIEIIRGKGSDLSISKDTVFKQLKCDEDNPMYEEFTDEYEELLPEVLASLEPAAALSFAPFPDKYPGAAIKGGTEVLYMIVTVGKKVCELTDSYFKGGDYVKGMLVDAMASSALFSFEKPVFERLRKMCADKSLGVKRRYEAPGHIPMEIQKDAFIALDAGHTLGLTISSGYMYDPVKSSCQVFETVGNERVMHLTHGCVSCSNTDCPHRIESVIIRVRDEKGDYEFSTAKGGSLMSVLKENGIKINAVCGGAGRCGKCAVRVLEGNIDISADDKNCFTDKELASGLRLSCRADVNEDILIEVRQEDEGTMLSLGAERGLAAGSLKTGSGEASEGGRQAGKTYVLENVFNDSGCAVAIDIGTTTLALSLVDLNSGKLIDTYTAVNSQRSLGADVITRIEAAGKGKAEELRKLIADDLAKGVESLLSRNNVEPDMLKKIAAAGNTTMLHLLMGYDVSSLGVYPFTPVDIILNERTLGEVLKPADIRDELKDVPLFLLPGNSAFVGADIVSGLFSLNFHENDKTCALIDLGTNGEMAVGNKDRLFVTSTAAGPAFEGGNIKWGVGSIRGAISNVEIEDGKAHVRTIGDELPATGICGTGVIETTAELFKNELMDETGVLDDDYFDDGFPLAVNKGGEDIVFTEKDVREIQLAKSAVRAGFETLLKRYGVGYSEIDKLYIAGGFGYFLNVSKAAAIGMIPEELLPRTEAAGNTSLAGAVKFLLDTENAKAAVTDIAEKGEEIALSSDKDFNELYMEYMMFE